MKKFEINLNTKFLQKIAEFDREKQENKLEYWGYNTDSNIKSMVADIKSGVGIKEPVEVIVCDSKALMIQGCHRLAAANKGGLNVLKAFVYFFKKLPEKFKSHESKMIEI